MTSWLIDKSALVRLAESADAAEWANRISRGLVRITTVTRLEIGFAARTGKQARAAWRAAPLAAMPVEYLTPAVEDRAVEVQLLLADKGRHRAPSQTSSSRRPRNSLSSRCCTWTRTSR